MPDKANDSTLISHLFWQNTYTFGNQRSWMSCKVLPQKPKKIARSISKITGVSASAPPACRQVIGKNTHQRRKHWTEWKFYSRLWSFRLAPVAQWTRALVFGTKSRGFESLQACWWNPCTRWQPPSCTRVFLHFWNFTLLRNITQLRFPPYFLTTQQKTGKRHLWN